MSTGQRPIHQVVNHLLAGDAIGNEVLTIQERLQAQGRASEIYALHFGPGLEKRARRLADYPHRARPDDVVLWHFSIGTEAAETVAHLPGPVVMRYHNITPAHFFAGVNRQAEAECLIGRKQLVQAAGFVELGLGVSEYNRAELDQLGYKHTAACPIIKSYAGLKKTRPSAKLAGLLSGRPVVLHVGRIAPNKRYDQLIKTHYFLRKIMPQAQLVLVGGHGGMLPYRRALDDLVAGLGAGGVVFTDHLSESDLMAAYTAADAYLCLSDHEGFCVPLIEAMALDLPVAAKRSSAVTETLGQAGLLLDEPSPARAAEALAALLADQDLREQIIADQRARLADYEPEKVWARFWSLLQPLAEG